VKPQKTTLLEGSMLISQAISYIDIIDMHHNFNNATTGSFTMAA